MLHLSLLGGAQCRLDKAPLLKDIDDMKTTSPQLDLMKISIYCITYVLMWYIIQRRVNLKVYQTTRLRTFPASPHFRFPMSFQGPP